MSIYSKRPFEEMTELEVYAALAELTQRIQENTVEKANLLQKLVAKHGPTAPLAYPAVGSVAGGVPYEAPNVAVVKAQEEKKEATTEDLDRLADQYLNMVPVFGMPALMVYIDKSGFKVSGNRPGNKVGAVLRHRRAKYAYDPRTETWTRTPADSTFIKTGDKAA